MSRLPLPLERVTRITENALHLCGEDEQFLSELGKAELVLAALDESDRLDEAMAVTDVEEAKTKLRAAELRLAEIQGRNEQKSKLRNFLLKKFDEHRAHQRLVAHEIARDADSVGVGHMRPELVAAGV